MAESDNVCCCDLTPHPDDLKTWTGSRAEGKRYQLINSPIHVKYIDATVHTQGGSPDVVTLKFFTNDDPGTAADDVNLWNLTLGATLGETKSTPPALDGLLFVNGLFVEVMSTDTSAEVQINIVYHQRVDYTPAIPETSGQRKGRLWDCYNDTPYGDNFNEGADGDDYSDTSSSSTPSSGTGSPIGGD